MNIVHTFLLLGVYLGRKEFDIKPYETVSNIFSINRCQTKPTFILFNIIKKGVAVKKNYNIHPARNEPEEDKAKEKEQMMKEGDKGKLLWVVFYFLFSLVFTSFQTECWDPKVQFTLSSIIVQLKYNIHQQVKETCRCGPILQVWRTQDLGK